MAASSLQTTLQNKQKDKFRKTLPESPYRVLMADYDPEPDKRVPRPAHSPVPDLAYIITPHAVGASRIESWKGPLQVRHRRRDW